MKQLVSLEMQMVLTDEYTFPDNRSHIQFLVPPINVDMTNYNILRTPCMNSGDLETKILTCTHRYHSNAWGYKNFILVFK